MEIEILQAPRMESLVSKANKCPQRPNSLDLSPKVCWNGQKSPLDRYLDDGLRPSLIIPYLYVGNHGHTQLETLRLHNITYILSLYELPLFLRADNNQQQSQSQQPHSHHHPNHHRNHHHNHQNHHHHHHHHRHQHHNHQHHPHQQQQHNSNQQQQQQPMDIDTIRVKCINMADSWDEVLDNYLDETLEFIDEARQNKCNVLVHCMAGISRSPAITIAYLMKSLNLSLTEAFNLVRGSRPQTDPNIGFMCQLVVYEQKLKTMRKEKKPMSPRLETINNANQTTATTTTNNTSTNTTSAT